MCGMPLTYNVISEPRSFVTKHGTIAVMKTTSIGRGGADVRDEQEPATNSAPKLRRLIIPTSGCTYLVFSLRPNRVEAAIQRVIRSKWEADGVKYPPEKSIPHCIRPIAFNYDEVFFHLASLKSVLGGQVQLCRCGVSNL